MKDTALVVFKKDTDLYTLNQQLSHYRETADIIDIDDYETYPNLTRILEAVKGQYKNLIYLTEDEDWLSFGRDLEKEYNRDFKSIVTHKKLAEHLLEVGTTPVATAAQATRPAAPANNQQQQTQQKQPPKQPPKDPNKEKQPINSLVIFPCSCPFNGSKNVVNNIASYVANNGLLMLPSIDRSLNQFLAQSTQLAIIQAYLGKDTALKSDVKFINVDFSNIAQGIDGVKSLIQQKGNVNLDNFTGTIYYSTQVPTHQAFVQAAGKTSKHLGTINNFSAGSNVSFYKDALEIYKFVEEQRPLRQKKNEELEKQQKHDEKQTKSSEHTQKEIEKKFGTNESTVNEFFRLREANPQQQPQESDIDKNKNKEKRKPDLTDCMIWALVEAAHRYSQGQEAPNETEEQTKKLGNEKLKKFLEIIGITHDIAAAEELAKKAGYALVLDTAKAIKSLTDKTDKKKQQKQPNKEATDSVSIMMDYKDYDKRIYSQFDPKISEFTG